MQSLDVYYIRFLDLSIKLKISSDCKHVLRIFKLPNYFIRTNPISTCVIAAWVIFSWPLFPRRKSPDKTQTAIVVHSSVNRNFETNILSPLDSRGGRTVNVEKSCRLPRFVTFIAQASVIRSWDQSDVSCMTIYYYSLQAYHRHKRVIQPSICS